MGLLRLLRRFPRVRLETSVALSDGGRPLLAYAFDLSEGGLGLRMPHAPPEDGTLLRISFYLPQQSEPFECMGRIAHPTIAGRDGSFRFGLSFVELDAEERRVLRRYINMRRFLFGDLRAPSTNPAVEKRMEARLVRARRQDLLM
jgi:hypothetical protein